MSSETVDHIAAAACQWCAIPKQGTVPGLSLCPVCDQKPLQHAEDSAKRKEQE